MRYRTAAITVRKIRQDREPFAGTEGYGNDNVERKAVWQVATWQVNALSLSQSVSGRCQQDNQRHGLPLLPPLP